MPGHYGDKKKKGTKKVSKGLAALAKKRPKVAAAIMKNKKKKYWLRRKKPRVMVVHLINHTNQNHPAHMCQHPVRNWLKVRVCSLPLTLMI